MEPAGLLLFSEQFVTGPYPMPGESVPLTPIFIFLIYMCIYIYIRTHTYIFQATYRFFALSYFLQGFRVILFPSGFSRYLISFRFFVLSYFFQVFRVILFLSGFSRYLISFRFFALSYFLQVFRVVLFPSSFSFKSLYIFLFSPMPATYAAYPTIPDVIILIMRDEIIFIFVSAVTKIRLEHFVYVSPPLSFKRF